LTIRSEEHFHRDYAAARRALLAAAEARGATLSSHPLSQRGPDEEELALDVAYLGPEAPERLLVVSSGIHGVEGFAGSALQHRLLREQLDELELPADTGLLLVHALNPWGFAWLRRVNERNVDLNRNFLRHPEEHVPNADYDELYPAINPTELHEESEAASRARLLAFAQEHGARRLQEVLSCGQYAHPTGMQFGGERDEESNRALRAIVRDELRGARKLAWVDVHTGLGPYGVPEMICEYPADHPGYARMRAWYGEAARSSVAGESVSAALHGVMERGVEAELPPGCESTIAAAEFGTYDPTRVFWAMRADNWLRHHGDRDSEQGSRIRDELLEVFRPDDRKWQREVLERGAAILRQARDGLTAGA
jgi:hypothetical protein